MIKDLIETFRKPSAKVLAQRELEEAQRQLLEAQSAAEYAANLSKYHAERIRRLRAYLLVESA
jgi:hypothetical protein